ncbi:hypothetical protein [Alsobacter sp. R-9]
MLRGLLAGALTATVLATGVVAQTTYGQFSSRGREQEQELIVPTLGDIMLGIQLRHIKLWYAGRSGSWDLAEYELRHLLQGLGRAALLYANIPVEQIQAVDAPMLELQSAIKARDAGRFVRVYRDVTSACNACHQAGAVGYIRIQTPSASPFTNQFYPGRP